MKKRMMKKIMKRMKVKKVRNQIIKRKKNNFNRYKKIKKFGVLFKILIQIKKVRKMNNFRMEI
jgi:hypothetical protein